MISNLKPADLNCNIFSCYDYNDYSLQELLCTFYTKINECVDLSNQTFDLAKWLVNQGLREQVAETMKAWWSEGRFGEIFTQDVLSGIDKRIEKNKTDIEAIKEDLLTHNPDITMIKPTMSNDEINRKLALGGTFVWKSGDYILEEDPTHIEHGKTVPKSFHIASNSTHIFEDGAVIKPFNGDRIFYTLIRMYDVENVTLIHPQIDGLRDDNKYKYDPALQWGYGITVYNTTNVRIEYPSVVRTTGDGIYIGYLWHQTGAEKHRTKQVFVNYPYIYDCRRNGISVCGGKDIYINGCHIEKIDGAWPKSCIDIEPENDNMCSIELENVNITNCTLINDNLIQIVKTKGFTKDCNINIDNIYSPKCGLPFAWYTADETNVNTVTATFNNIRIDKFKSQLFHINDKPIDDTLTIKNVVLGEKTEATDPNDPAYMLYHALVGLYGTKDPGKLKESGGVVVDDILFKGIGNNKPYVFFGVWVNDYTGSTPLKFKDIHFNNVRCSKDTSLKFAQYQPGAVDFSTCTFSNINIKDTSGYYLYKLESNNCTFKKDWLVTTYDFVYTISDGALDGEYELNVFSDDKASGGFGYVKKFTIAKEAVTFYPKNANLKIQRAGKVKFIKKGNNVIFTEIPLEDVPTT